MIPLVVASERGRAQTFMTFKLQSLNKLVDECYKGVVTYKQPSLSTYFRIVARVWDRMLPLVRIRSEISEASGSGWKATP